MTDEAWSALIEEALCRALPEREEASADLHEAMRWAVEGGGKRVRPRICLAAAVAVGGRAEDALWPACAASCWRNWATRRGAWCVARSRR